MTNFDQRACPPNSTGYVAAYLEYSDAEHRYFVDGKELISVTQVLDKAGLISPFCKDEIARYRGSKVHEFTANDDVLPLDFRKVPRHLRGYLRAWRAFRRDAQFTPTLIEHRIDDLVHGYSGRFDRLGKCYGSPLFTLIDIKTSTALAIPGYARVQLAAYALAFDAKRVFFRQVVVLGPDGRYNTERYGIETHAQDKAEWLAILKTAQEGN